MVLHLLSKKSWNVYNGANVERVRRDQADAHARQEEEDRRSQLEDAQRRVAILRGDDPPLLRPAEQETSEESSKRDQTLRGHDASSTRQRRRRHGEDDTDRDIRFAREDAEAGRRAKEALLLRQQPGGKEDNAPLVDADGHMLLIAPPAEPRSGSSRDTEQQARKRRRDDETAEERKGMRFSDAAGFQNGMERPWYADEKSRSKGDPSTSASTSASLPHVPNKDVWGNDDPRRQQREQHRVVGADPFAAMQRAQHQLKRSERDREAWRRERMVEVEGPPRKVEREGRQEEELDGFRLDEDPAERNEQRDRERRRKHARHHRHRHNRHKHDGHEGSLRREPPSLSTR